MKSIASFGVVLAMLGCQTTEPVPPGTLTKGEVEVRKMNLEGLKIGDRLKALDRFAQVQKVPFGRRDYEVYDIYNPNDQIQLALAYFDNDRLERLEFRYFDGVGIRSLSNAGGWMGIRDYLISRFGPPSRTGADVRLVTDVPGLKADQAKFNGEWIFSRQNRQLNFVAFSDAKGGIGVITLQNTRPAPPVVTQTVVRRVAPAVPETRPVQTQVAKPTPQPTPASLPPAPPNPGF